MLCNLLETWLHLSGDHTRSRVVFVFQRFRGHFLAWCFFRIVSFDVQLMESMPLAINTSQLMADIDCWFCDVSYDSLLKDIYHHNLTQYVIITYFYNPMWTFFSGLAKLDDFFAPYIRFNICSHSILII